MTRADGNEFADLVWQELDARGLIPSDIAYQGVRDAVTRSGEQAWAAVLGLIGHDRWNAANAMLLHPWVSDDPQRILGFGWWLTRFLIAPLRPSSPADAAVADAGALANLIVALYDQFVDSGMHGPAILAPMALEPVAQASAGPNAPAIGPPDASTDVLGDLVQRYFEMVAAIPGSQPSGVVDSLLPTAIRRMYDAENRLVEVGTGAGDRTPEGHRPCSHALLRRKAALPFVVMGLPGWSASCRPTIATAGHLRWMYRVGTFLGWIDDAVDLDDDAAACAANRVRCALAAHPARAAGLAASIASAGARCLDDWRRYTGNEPVTEPAVTGILPAVIYSWFGATRRHA